MTAEQYRRGAVRAAIATTVMVIIALVLDASTPLFWAAGTAILSIGAFLAARWRIAGVVLGTVLFVSSLVITVWSILQR